MTLRAGARGGRIERDGAFVAHVGVLVLSRARDLRSDLEGVGAEHLAEIVAPGERAVAVLDAVAGVVAGETGDGNLRRHVGPVRGIDLGKGQPQRGTQNDRIVRRSVNRVLADAEAEVVDRGGRERVLQADGGDVAGPRTRVRNEIQRVVAEREHQLPLVVREPVRELRALRNVVVEPQQFLAKVGHGRPVRHVVAAGSEEVGQRIRLEQQRPVLRPDGLRHDPIRERGVRRWVDRRGQRGAAKIAGALQRGRHHVHTVLALPDVLPLLAVEEEQFVLLPY